jgi:hypothetical protein
MDCPNYEDGVFCSKMSELPTSDRMYMQRSTCCGCNGGYYLSGIWRGGNVSAAERLNLAVSVGDQQKYEVFRSYSENECNQVRLDGIRNNYYRAAGGNPLFLRTIGNASTLSYIVFAFMSIFLAASLQLEKYNAAKQFYMVQEWFLGGGYRQSQEKRGRSGKVQPSDLFLWLVCFITHSGRMLFSVWVVCISQVH